MNRFLALGACVALLVAIAGAQSAVAVRKPLIAAPPAMRQVPLKPMCVDDQGAMSRPGDYSWTSRASDGTAHDCTPYGCSLATGLCRTSAATTNQCRPGYSWWATDNTCRQCAPGDTVDAQGRCVQANPNPQ